MKSKNRGLTLQQQFLEYPKSKFKDLRILFFFPESFRGYLCKIEDVLLFGLFSCIKVTELYQETKPFNSNLRICFPKIVAGILPHLKQHLSLQKKGIKIFISRTFKVAIYESDYNYFSFFSFAICKNYSSQGKTSKKRLNLPFGRCRHKNGLNQIT